MLYTRYIILVLIILRVAPAPTVLSAETLSILRGDASKTISIAHDQTIVIQSNIPFKKATIANPYTAHIVFLSNHHVEVTGLSTGRTSLSFFDSDGRVVNSTEIRVVRKTERFQPRSVITVPEMAPHISLPVQHGRATDTVTVPFGAAVIIESDVRFSGIMLANTSVAYTMTLSDDSVYVLGRAIGTTTLSFLRNNGSRGTSIQIEIVPNMVDIK